jgi:hypothetical protein
MCALALDSIDRTPVHDVVTKRPGPNRIGEPIGADHDAAGMLRPRRDRAAGMCSVPALVSEIQREIVQIAVCVVVNVCVINI